MRRSNPFGALYKSGEIAATQGVVLPNPLIMDVELTNHCNLNCVMCARRLMTREKGYMSGVHCFDLLVAEAKELGVKGIRFILWGEPLLHPQVNAAIKFVRSCGLLVHLTTNGLLLPKLSVEAFDALDSLIVSFQGTTAAGYTEVRGDHFAEVTANLRRFLDLRGTRETPFIQGSTTILDESIESQNVFSKWWTLQGVDRVSTWHTNLERVKQLVPLSLYKRQSLPAREFRCIDPFYKMHVLWDGTCVACCDDVDGEILVGNFPTQSLAAIWDSEFYFDIRDQINFMKSGLKMAGNDLPKVCKNCYTRF